MVYADFDFYTTEYYGQTIQEADFPRLALRASAYLDYCTMGRAKTRANMPEVKMCCCALAEQYAVVEAMNAAAVQTASTTSTEGGETQSESVGSWSKSYRSKGESVSNALNAAQAGNAALSAVVAQYLAPTGLLRARGYMA
jgi:hypothetical protein